MKKIVALLLSLMLAAGIPGALAVNEDVEGTVGIYSSAYPFVLDMLDEAIKAEFPNLEPAFDGSFTADVISCIACVVHIAVTFHILQGVLDDLFRILFLQQFLPKLEFRLIHAL